MVEFCGCLNMDLPAPRTFEEAREIQQRGQLKLGYFTNFIRLRIEYILPQEGLIVYVERFLIFVQRNNQWLDGMTIVDPKTLPWKDAYGFEDEYEFNGYNFWSYWNWSGLESIRLPEFSRNVVCMSPYQKHDFPKCQLDPYTIMEKIGKENGEQFKNLPFFTKAYNETFVPTPTPIYGDEASDESEPFDWADFFKPISEKN